MKLVLSTANGRMQGCVRHNFLLTEFKGCSVNYRLSFFPLRFMAQVQSTRAMN